jgi:hypothetical protein
MPETTGHLSDRRKLISMPTLRWKTLERPRTMRREIIDSPIAGPGGAAGG